MDEVAAGLMERREYRSKWYGEEEATAWEMAGPAARARDSAAAGMAWAAPSWQRPVAAGPLALLAFVGIV